MKRLLITLLLSLLAVAAVMAWRWGPLLVSSSESSDLYRRYEHNPHIRATDLHNFPVNDTLAVDVTLLQATDSVGWEILKKDFNVLPVPPVIQEILDQGKDIVAVQLTPKDTPGQPMDTTDLLRNNVMAISRLNHMVSIFYTHTQQEIYAVSESKYK